MSEVGQSINPDQEIQGISSKQTKEHFQAITEKHKADPFFLERKKIRSKQIENLTHQLQEGSLTQGDINDILSSIMAEGDTLIETDPLMEIKNRRGLEQELEKAIAHAQRTGEPLSIAFADLDHFKLFNDTQGHDAGDNVLRVWAGFLKSELRKEDSLGRYGGEEVVVILPGTTEDGGVALLDRLREKMPIVIKDYLSEFQFEQDITMSVGVYQVELDSTKNIEEMRDQAIKTADTRVYEAKTGGRNRVVGGK